MTAVVVNERTTGCCCGSSRDSWACARTRWQPDRDLSNRSLTLAEVEAVRAFNRAARAAGVSRAVHAQTMRFGAATRMKRRRPDADEARIDTPQWALDRAREADVEIVAGIERLGVRVIGDLASLAVPQPGRPGGEAPLGSILVAPDVAAEMALGVLLASGIARADGSAASGRAPSGWSP